MTTHNARSSGRRSGRGPRRDRRRSDDYRPDRSASETDTPSAPAKPVGWWQKIVSLLSGKKNAGATPARRSASAPERGADRPRAAVTSSYPTTPKAARKPEAVEVTTPKLYVGNLSFDATESDLSELFNGVGAVQSAEIVSHKDTFRSKGFAFVTMGSVEEAKRAVTELHDKEFMGRKLVVSGAKTPMER